MYNFLLNLGYLPLSLSMQFPPVDWQILTEIIKFTKIFEKNLKSRYNCRYPGNHEPIKDFLTYDKLLKIEFSQKILFRIQINYY